MMRSRWIWLAIAGAVAVGLFSALRFVTIRIAMPTWVTVVYDREARTYVSYQCISTGAVEYAYTKNPFSPLDPDNGAGDLVDTSSEVSLDEARRLARRGGGGPDQECKRADGFAYNLTLWRWLRVRYAAWWSWLKTAT